MTPLNEWKRRILLWVLIAIFIVIAPLILLNSFGYRLDSALGLVKTGGLYLHSEIPNTSVYINGKYIKDNGAFIRNTFIQKLKPNQNYKIEVYKDGYNGWIKELHVYPGIVSEGHVLMLPEELERTEIFPFFNQEGEGVYSPVPGFTKVSRTIDGRIIPENSDYIDAVVLFEEENPYEVKQPEVIESENILDEEPELPEYYVELGIEDPDSLENLIETNDEITWLQNGDIVLYWIDDEKSIPYYYCGGEKERICNEQIVLDWKNEIIYFDYLPGRDDVWVVLINDGIYAVEVDPRSERNIQEIYLGSNLDFRVDNSGNLIVKDNGAYFEVDL